MTRLLHCSWITEIQELLGRYGQRYRQHADPEGEYYQHNEEQFQIKTQIKHLLAQYYSANGADRSLQRLEWDYTIEDDADYRTHNMVKEVMKNNLQDLEMEIKQIERVKMKAMDNKIEQLKKQKTQSQAYIKKNKPWDFSLH